MGTCTYLRRGRVPESRSNHAHVIKFKFILYAWYKIQLGHGTSFACILYMVGTLEIHVYTKGRKANHHKKTFTKIFSLEIFFFFFKMPFQTCHSYVNAKFQRFPTAAEPLRWWSAPSSGPGATFTCATCRLQSSPDIHLEFYRVGHWTFLFPWQVSHNSLMPCRVPLQSSFFLFIRPSQR